MEGRGGRWIHLHLYLVSLAPTGCGRRLCLGTGSRAGARKSLEAFFPHARCKSAEAPRQPVRQEASRISGASRRRACFTRRDSVFPLERFLVPYGPDKSAPTRARLHRVPATRHLCLAPSAPHPEAILGAEACTSADSDPGRPRELWLSATPPLLLLTHCLCGLDPAERRACCLRRAPSRVGELNSRQLGEPRLCLRSRPWTWSRGASWLTDPGSSGAVRSRAEKNLQDARSAISMGMIATLANTRRDGASVHTGANVFALSRMPHDIRSTTAFGGARGAGCQAAARPRAHPWASLDLLNSMPGTGERSAAGTGKSGKRA